MNDFAISPADVSAFIAFHSDPNCDRIQREGTTALYNILERKEFAYLADEVGMGKTWQAMAVVALTLRQKPDARVVVICPGEDLQRKWKKNWAQFVRDSYRLYDDRIKNRLDGGIVLEAIHSPRVKDFAEHLVLDFEQLHVLRYSAFSRPFYVDPRGSVESIKDKYRRWIKALGRLELDPEEENAFAGVAARSDRRLPGEELSRELNARYAREVGKVVAEKPIDLLVLDEAQYLRTDNARNSNLLTIFGPKKVKKVLFLSATPIHNQKDDLKRLERYVGQQLVRQGANGADLVEAMKEFMVRRVRTYKDASDRHYSKHEYRQYSNQIVDARDNPYYSLVLALVQKRLGKVLEGRGNIFRFGECSSFESLRSSANTYRKRGEAARTGDGQSGEDVSMVEPEEGGPGEREVEFERGDGRRPPKDEEDSPDRRFLDKLSDSFKKLPGARQPLVLPHAKVDQSVRRLAKHHLSDATLQKGIVFVRRLDTVDELKLRLEEEFQKEVDRRIEAWQDLLRKNGKQLPLDFWSPDGREEQTEDDSSDNASEEEPDSDNGSEEETDSSRPADREIRFLAALRKKRSSSEPNGRLYSLSNRLLRQEDHNRQGRPKSKSPLIFLLEDEAKDGGEHEAVWMQLLQCLEVKSLPVPQKAEGFLKRRALKRFVLQTMRRSDFLVDLYIINASRGNRDLSEALIEFLQGTFAPGSGAVAVTESPLLARYILNWRQRLAACIEHWDVILDNCFPALTAEGMNAQIDALFAHVTPVASRSGRVHGKHTVNQFKLPGYPNLLVCTDVLKEGIDLHLFCDRVYHYGIAWTAGDLEQRIGRVDRFLSKISRTIGVFEGEAAGVPKLEVLFPTLAGTLDVRQVDHVRRMKAVADLMMDFGEALQEDGKHSTDELYGVLTQRAEVTRPDNGTFDAKHHFAIEPGKWPPPDDANNVEPALEGLAEAVLRRVAPEWQRGQGWSYEEAGNKVWQLRYLPRFKALKLTLREPVSEPEKLPLNARLAWRKIKSTWGFYQKRDLLLPTQNGERHGELLQSFIWDGNVMNSYRATAVAEGFTIKPEMGAVVWERTDPVTGRGHHLYLETAGEAFLLRSYVAEKDWNKERGGRYRFLASLNDRCRVGHFQFQENQLFYVVFMHDPTLMSETLLKEVAAFSDCIQLWLTASDEDDFVYRTPVSLHSVISSCRQGEMQEWQDTLYNFLGGASDGSGNTAAS